jgi:hypothetical protein
MLYVYCPSKYTYEVNKPVSAKRVVINGVEYNGNDLNIGSCIVGGGMSSISCTNHKARLSGNKLTITTSILPENIIVSNTKFPPFDKKQETSNVVTIDKRIIKKIHCSNSTVTFSNNIFDDNVVIDVHSGHILITPHISIDQLLASIHNGSSIRFSSATINTISVVSKSDQGRTNTIEGFVLLVGGFVYSDGSCNVLGSCYDRSRPTITSYCDSSCKIQINEI